MNVRNVGSHNALGFIRNKVFMPFVNVSLGITVHYRIGTSPEFRRVRSQHKGEIQKVEDKTILRYLELVKDNVEKTRKLLFF